MKYTSLKKKKSFIILVCNYFTVSHHCVVDMEAAVESAGDVRRHPDDRGHQAPGKLSGAGGGGLLHSSDH